MNKGFLKTMVLIGVVAIWGAFSTAYCDHHNLNEAQREEQAQQQGRAQEQVNQQEVQVQDEIQDAQEEIEDVDGPEANQHEVLEQIRRAQNEIEDAVGPEANQQAEAFMNDPGAYAEAAVNEVDANVGREIANDVLDNVEIEAEEVIEQIAVGGV